MYQKNARIARTKRKQQIYIALQFGKSCAGTFFSGAVVSQPHITIITIIIRLYGINYFYIKKNIFSFNSQLGSVQRLCARASAIVELNFIQLCEFFDKIIVNCKWNWKKMSPEKTDKNTAAAAAAAQRNTICIGQCLDRHKHTNRNIINSNTLNFRLLLLLLFYSLFSSGFVVLLFLTVANVFVRFCAFSNNSLSFESGHEQMLGVDLYVERCRTT